METNEIKMNITDNNKEFPKVWQEEYLKISQYYVSLVAKCDSVFFQRTVQTNAGYQIDTEPIWKKFIWHYANPVAWLFIHPSFGSSFMFIFGMVSVMFWLLEWPFVICIANLSNNSNFFTSTNPFSITTIFSLFFTLFFLPAGYIKIKYFFSNMYFPILLKISYCIFVAIVIFIIPELLLLGNKIAINTAFHPFWIQNWTSRILLIVFFIPSVVFIMLSILDFCTFLVEKTRLFLPTFRLLVNTVSTNGMNEVVHSVINTNEKTWRVQDLSLSELSTIEELAKSNLESSEKKTIPWLLLLAVLGIFSGSNLNNNINQALETIINSWFHPELYISVSFIGIIYFLTNSILFIILLISLALFFVIISDLFKNIFIQSQIIDLCIASKYAVREVADKIQPKLKSEEGVASRRLISIWKKLISRFQ